MNNIGKSRRDSRRKGCRRNRRQSGGDGWAYTLGGPVAGAPIINNYGQEIVRMPSCEEATRPGYINPAMIKGGLPGFAGGARRMRGGGGAAGSPYPQTYASMTSGATNPSGGYTLTPEPVPGATDVTTNMRGGSNSGFRGGVLETGADQLGDMVGDSAEVVIPKTGGRRKHRSSSRRSRKMYGGRYAIGAEVTGPANIAFARTDYTGCGAGLEGIHNALNKGDGFPGNYITAPPPQYDPASGRALVGGRRHRGSRGSRQSGGVGGVDSMLYMSPRAGYTHEPSIGAGAAGTLSDGKTPFLINVPYSAQPVPSPACLKTGGRRKVSRKNRKNQRKSRKANRKGSRKGNRN